MCDCGYEQKIEKMPRKLDLWAIIASYSPVKALPLEGVPKLCGKCTVRAFRRFIELVLKEGGGCVRYYGGEEKLKGYLKELEGRDTVIGAKVGDLAFDVAWE